MRFRTKLAMASAAAALMAGTALAQQTTITLAVGGGTGDIAANVDLVDTSLLAGQTGTLSFTITPADTDFGGQALPTSGIVKVDLTNAAFSQSVTAAAVSMEGGAGSSPNDVCLEGDTVLLSTGGTIGSSSVSFEIPDIANCGNGATTTGTGAGVEGVLRVTLPIALNSVADANFSVGVTTVNATLAASTPFDNNNALGTGTDSGGVDPLVEVGPAFSVAFSANNGMDDTQLELGLTPPFSAFDTMGTDFTATVGDFIITALANSTDLQGTAVGSPTALDLSITADEDAAGIDRFTVGAATLTRVTGTNTFSADGTAIIGAATGTAVPVDVFLSGAAATNPEPMSTAGQTFSPAATLTTAGNSEIDETASSALAEITRAGDTGGPFAWVALEPANLNTVFRFTGLQQGAQVFATISNLNGAADLASNRINDFDVTGAGLTANTTSGGELQISAQQLGAALSSAGLLDLNAANVTRGKVEFFIEQSGTVVNRLMFNAEGAVNSTPEFTNN